MTYTKQFPLNIVAAGDNIYEGITKLDNENQAILDILNTVSPTSASGIINTATGNISATTVQNAINELDTEKSSITQLQNYSFIPKFTDIITKQDVRYFGITPDGVTDWRASGELDTALQYCSTHNTANDDKMALYFPAGYYKCAMDNYYSNVICIFAEGAVFGGTIHAAINTSAGDPSINRPSNVKFYGTVGSYERVGSYNCDDVYIERIHLHSDPTKRIGGGKTAGCHFYLDTRNLIIDEIIIDDVASNGSYALGIDGNTTYEPVNVHIGKVIIKDSEVHGVYLCGTGHYIGKIRVDGYGKGSQTTTLPMAISAESMSLKGVWLNRLYDSHVPSVVVTQSAGASGTAGDGVYCDDGKYTLGTVKVTNCTARGFAIDAQVESPEVQADKIIVKQSAGGHGVVVNRGVLSADYISSTYNSQNGLQTLGGGKIYCRELIGNYNTAIGIEIGSASVANIQRMVASENLNSTRQVIFTGAKQSSIGSIEIIGSATTPNTTGGLQIASCNDITIQRLDTIRCGVAASANAAVRVETSNRVAILSGYLQPGAGQGLRLVTISDCNFNGLHISGHVDNISATGLTRIGFSNCRSTGGTTSQTNIASGSVVQSNCEGIVLP